MTVEKIKLLLEKYFAGESSLDEEKQLKQYFTEEEVEDELTQFKSLFQFLKAEKNVEMARPIELPKANSSLKLRLWYWKATAAAIALLIVSIVSFKQFQRPNNASVLAHNNPNYIVLDEGDDPQKAFEQAQAALMLVSKKMRKGERAAAEGLLKVKSATDEIEQIMNIK